MVHLGEQSATPDTQSGSRGDEWPSELGPRLLYHELLRVLLPDGREALEEVAKWVPAEVIFKALIIREFMESHGIEDIRSGIRGFYAFQRERLRHFGPGLQSERRSRRRAREKLTIRPATG